MNKGLPRPLPLFDRLHNLRELSIFFSAMRLFDAVFEAAPSGILPSLEIIDLYGCFTDDLWIEDVAQALSPLRHYPRLSQLCLDLTDFAMMTPDDTQPEVTPLDFLAHVEVNVPSRFQPILLTFMRACATISSLVIWPESCSSLAPAMAALPNPHNLRHLSLSSPQGADLALSVLSQLPNLVTLTLENHVPLKSALPRLSALHRLERLVCRTECVVTDDFIQLSSKQDASSLPCLSPSLDEIVCDFPLRSDSTSAPGIDFDGMSRILELAAPVGVDVTGKTVEEFKVEQRRRAAEEQELERSAEE